MFSTSYYDDDWSGPTLTIAELLERKSRGLNKFHLTEDSPNNVTSEPRRKKARVDPPSNHRTTNVKKEPLWEELPSPRHNVSRGVKIEAERRYSESDDESYQYNGRQDSSDSDLTLPFHGREPCTLCTNVHSPASVYCRDCLQHLCYKCLRNHDQFPSLRGHSMKNIKQERLEHIPKPRHESRRPTVHRDDRDDHHDHYIRHHRDDRNNQDDRTEHKMGIKSERLSNSHHQRKLSNQGHIKNESKRDHLKNMAKMRSLVSGLHTTERQFRSSLDTLAEEKTEMYTKIDECHNQLVNELEQKKEKTKSEMKKKYYKIRDNIDQNKKEVRNVITEIKHYVDKYGDEKKYANTINYRRSLNLKEEQRMISLGESCIQKYDHETNKQAFLEFKPYSPLKLCDEHDSYGTTISVPSALVGMFSIQLPDETVSSEVTGLCCTQYGSVLVADSKTERLKVLDKDFKVESHKDISGIQDVCSASSPYGGLLSLFSTGNVVISQRSGHIIYMNKRNNVYEQERNMFVGLTCRGICFNKSNRQVHVLSRTKPYGNTLRSFDTGGGFNTEFKVDGDFVATKGDKLYISKGDNDSKIPRSYQTDDKIYVYNSNGELKQILEDGDLRAPCGMCVDKDENLYVCGRDSNNIVQFDKDGRKKGVILNEDDLMKGPKAICYDEKNHRLLVGGNASHLQVYDLKILIKA